MAAPALLKKLIHRSLRNPAGESVIRAMNRRVPAFASRLGTKIAAQPSDYPLDEVREVEHLGMTWRFRPHDYFQWHHLLGFPDAVLQTLLGVVPEGSTVVDIGANVGLYSLLLSRRAARVVSFEPNPATAEAFRYHVRRNAISNVTVEQVALGAGDAVGKLVDPFGTKDSGKYTLRVDPGASDENGIQVAMRSLDRYLADNDVDSVGLIKVDVEGHEPEVLQGAMGTITRCSPRLVIEVSPAWYADRWDSYCKVLDRLDEMYRFFEIGAGVAGPTLRPIRMSRDPRDRAQRNVVGVPSSETVPPFVARHVV